MLQDMFPLLFDYLSKRRSDDGYRKGVPNVHIVGAQPTNSNAENEVFVENVRRDEEGEARVCTDEDIYDV